MSDAGVAAGAAIGAGVATVLMFWRDYREDMKRMKVMQTFRRAAQEEDEVRR